jgi:hypothetical protein
MLFGEIIAIYSEKCTEPIRTKGLPLGFKGLNGARW